MCAPEEWRVDATKQSWQRMGAHIPDRSDTNAWKLWRKQQRADRRQQRLRDKEKVTCVHTNHMSMFKFDM
jgi:hypothetical protein